MFTDRVITGGNAFASVRRSMIIALLGLKDKVRGQSQTSEIKVKSRNQVGGTSILNRGRSSSFGSVYFHFRRLCLSTGQLL